MTSLFFMNSDYLLLWRTHYLFNLRSTQRTLGCSPIYMRITRNTRLMPTAKPAHTVSLDLLHTHTAISAFDFST